jgi:nitrogen fixation/metabolism regulation signal transduction histidine kinase
MIVLLIALLQTTVIVIHAIICAMFNGNRIVAPTVALTIAAIKVISTVIFAEGTSTRYDNLFFGLTFNNFTGKNRKNNEKNKKHKNDFSHGILLSERILREHK